MQRIRVPAGSLRPGEVVIRDRREIHHCVRVRRIQAGQAVECFDGQGHRGTGVVVRAGGAEVVVEVDRVLSSEAVSGRLHIAASLIRPARFDWMIEKLTELGAGRVTPLVTERTTIRPGRSDSAGRVERWERLAAEAAKQCGSDWIPVIAAPRALPEFLDELPEQATVLIPTLEVPGLPLREAAGPLREVEELIVLIGPEGDFTPGEVRLALAKGAQAVSLGRRTLRSETAAVAAAAVLQDLLEGG